MGTIEVDLSLCQGHAKCALLAPELFDLDENGQAHYVGDEILDSADPLYIRALRAIEGCPEGAITGLSAEQSSRPSQTPEQHAAASKYRLRCPCGELVGGPTEDELVDNARAHLASLHPQLANSYGREQILALAF